MAASRPQENEPVDRGFVNTQALRALVRNHVGAARCPASVDRDQLIDIAVRLRLLSPADAALAPNMKRKRVDRVGRLQKRKVIKTITVKCALHSRVRPGAYNNNNIAFHIVRQVQRRVEAYSRRAVNASLSLSGIVKGIFRTKDDVVSIASTQVPPELFTQTFVRQLLLGTAEASQPSQLVVDYHRDHPQLVLQGHRHLGDRNIYSAGATQYLTNLKTALRSNLDTRIKTACRCLGLPKSDEAVVRFRINGWTLPPRFGCCLPQSEEADHAVNMHRRVLGLIGQDRINDRWLQSDANLPAILRYNVFLNKTYQESGDKLFNIVPICSTRAHFVRIDTSVLYGILRDAGVIRRQIKSSTFESLKDVFWPDILDLRKVKPRGYEFGWSVTTDGISLCTTFEKAIEVPTTGQTHVQADYAPVSGDVVVGNDPGRTNIYYMAGVVDGQTKVLRLTRLQYYTESGVLTARRNTETWSRSIKRQMDEMSQVSTKGASWVGHESYISRFDQHQQDIWTEYLRPRWARQRLSLYGGKKRVFANFFNRLVSLFSGGRLVVAYGNGKFASGGVGEQSVPTTRAYKECASRVVTYLTDEFRTSKVDCNDNNLLQLLSTMSRTRYALRGLLYNTQQDRFVSRDLNAALNIRRALIGPKPQMLCRQGVVQRLEQRIVKRIKAR